jgi:hypothetical protein
MSEASGFYENRKMLKHFKMEASLKRKSESVEVSVERQVVCKHDDENAIVDVYEYRDQPEERKSPNNGGHSVCEVRLVPSIFHCCLLLVCVTAYL